MVSRTMQVCILRGTHRYEKGAIALGRPLVDELCRRGVGAELRDVPPFAADRHLDRPEDHHMFRDIRTQWWHNLVREEKAIFSLHNYCNGHACTARCNGSRQIGEVENSAGRFGIFITERTGFARLLWEGPRSVLNTLAQLRRQNRSMWEDGSLFFSSIIEIPAVPDEKDPGRLKIDIERTKDAGFLGRNVVLTIAEEIERITGTGRRH